MPRSCLQEQYNAICSLINTTLYLFLRQRNTSGPKLVEILPFVTAWTWRASGIPFSLSLSFSLSLFQAVSLCVFLFVRVSLCLGKRQRCRPEIIRAAIKLKFKTRVSE